jgi:hypothetical protein
VRRVPVRAGAVTIAAALLGTGCVVWAAVPLADKGWAGFALFLAITAVTAGALRLALIAVPVPEDSFLLSGPVRAWLRVLEILRQVPWEEGAVVALLWLEVLHSSRPGHTAVLGAALMAADPGAGGRRGPAGAGRGRRDAARGGPGRGLGAAAGAGRGGAHRRGRPGPAVGDRRRGPGLTDCQPGMQR